MGGKVADLDSEKRLKFITGSPVYLGVVGSECVGGRMGGWSAWLV